MSAALFPVAVSCCWNRGGGVKGQGKNSQCFLFLHPTLSRVRSMSWDPKLTTPKTKTRFGQSLHRCHSLLGEDALKSFEHVNMHSITGTIPPYLFCQKSRGEWDRKKVIKDQRTPSQQKIATVRPLTTEPGPLGLSSHCQGVRMWKEMHNCTLNDQVSSHASS